ncbi:hypothetical protein PInf_014499 [Phytophthora infestans]|nr:hypothetical protein PInf_014499 [Phytophthora infestans]
MAHRTSLRAHKHVDYVFFAQGIAQDDGADLDYVPEHNYGGAEDDDADPDDAVDVDDSATVYTNVDAAKDGAATMVSHTAGMNGDNEKDGEKDVATLRDDNETASSGKDPNTGHAAGAAKGVEKDDVAANPNAASAAILCCCRAITCFNGSAATVQL